MRDDGTIGLWLPVGKHAISLSGGPFFSIGDAAEGRGHDLREIEIKGGEQPTVQFRVIRITPKRQRTFTALAVEPPINAVGNETSDMVVRPATLQSNTRRSKSDTRATNSGTAGRDEPFEPRLAIEGKPPAHAAVGRFSGMVRLDAAAKDLEGRESIRDESLKINRTVDNGIANVFVYLAKSPDGRPFAVPQQVFKLRTDGKGFSPRAGILRVGQEWTLHNDGALSANFHVFPSRNPGINHVMLPGGQGNPRLRMAISESVPFEVRNDVDSRMRATMLVLDHPFAAVTDELGAFEIENLPPGKYAFRVWHERSRYLDRALPIEIKPGETTKVRLSYKLDRFER
jgi:hypothetical protein